jgi:hypothetical protein
MLMEEHSWEANEWKMLITGLCFCAEALAPLRCVAALPPPPPHPPAPAARRPPHRGPPSPLSLMLQGRQARPDLA